MRIGMQKLRKERVALMINDNRGRQRHKVKRRGHNVRAAAKTFVVAAGSVGILIVARQGLLLGN